MPPPRLPSAGPRPEQPPAVTPPLVSAPLVSAPLLVAPPSGPSLRHPPLAASQTIVVLLVVAMLYFGRDIFAPLALAALLAFMLDPLVNLVRRTGLGRNVAVLLVILSTVTVLAGTAWFVGGQVVQLSKDLPTYQKTVQQKLRGLRQLNTGHGPLDDASRMLGAVEVELDAAQRELAKTTQRAAPRTAQRVVVEAAPRTALQTMGDWLQPMLAPVGTAGIVLVVLVFLLLERNDMRERLLRLVGGDMHRTTEALGDAGERVSRYLGMQLLVNVGYGVPMAAGLWLIGIPGALLWGVLAGLMRFVPYVGPVIAAVFPLALAVAVDPGWGMLGWTLALVVTLELVSNNLVEPWLYGSSTGLSPLAIIISAVVWTALWGPAGLILATPLTVCLAVMGRHLPGLQWLDVLLGNTPVYDAPTRLYQRLLADDAAEAMDLASDEVDAHGLQAFYNTTALPALRLATQAHGRLATAEHQKRLCEGMAALLRELRLDHPVAPSTAGQDGSQGGQGSQEVASLSPTPSALSPVADDAAANQVPWLCIGTRLQPDTLAAEMLGHSLACALHEKHPAAGWADRVLSASALDADHLPWLNLDGVRVVCLSSFSSTPQAQVRHATRRLQRHKPGLQIVAALWNATPDMVTPDAAAVLGVQAVVTSLADALAQLQALLLATAPAVAATLTTSDMATSARDLPTAPTPGDGGAQLGQAATV